MPKGDHTILEGILWQTSRNFELRSCAYFDNGKITSENLIKFATEDNNFFSVNWKGNKHLQEAKDVSKLPKNEREATKAKRAMVEALVQECKSIEKHQRWNKGAIASWVSEKLLEQYEINLSENAISRHYMNK
jgi:hypothetical protein